jgi:hypothetical protein
MMQFQRAISEEIRSDIYALQEQDYQMDRETTDLFAGIRQELEAQNQKSLIMAYKFLRLKLWFKLFK